MRDRIEKLLGNRDSKKIRYKTWAIRLPQGRVGIKHHNTVILTYDLDGTCIVDCHNWYTPTTKERLNNWLPEGWMIYQEDYVWYLVNTANPDNPREYVNGMQISPSGSLIGS